MIKSLEIYVGCFGDDWFTTGIYFVPNSLLRSLTSREVVFIPFILFQDAQNVDSSDVTIVNSNRCVDGHSCEANG